MLNIRLEQIATLRENAVRCFEDAVLPRLREKFREKLAERSDDDLRVLVRRGIGRAAVYRITLRPDIARLIELMLRFDSELLPRDEPSWLLGTLTTRGINGTSRLDSIENFAALLDDIAE